MPLSIRDQDAADVFLFSIDYEDVRHELVGRFHNPDRLPLLTERWLAFLHTHRVTATFFVSGDTAQRHATLIKEIVAAGHEIGCHGWQHIPLTRYRPEAFVDDVRRSLDVLHAVGAPRVVGFRAPYLSLTEASAWAYGRLAELGFVYSSSVLPARNPLYGWASFGVDPQSVAGVLELPVSVAWLGILSPPFASGACFVFYALCPMHLYFARMYNHEVFALFGIVLCLHAYGRWVHSGSRGALAALAASLMLATATAWPAYYLTVLLPVHYRWTVASPRRTATLGATLLGVSLLTFALFLAHGYWLEGPDLFRDLPRTVLKVWFSNRLDWGPEFTTVDFLEEEVKQTLRLFTLPVVALAALGATYTLGTAAIERRLDAASRLLVLLLVLGTVHVFLSKQEAMGHDYYLYYLLPGVALAAGVATRLIAAVRVRPVYRWVLVAKRGVGPT